MISEDMKVSAFKEMAEVFDRKIHSQQFPVEGAVAGLSGRHLPGEKRDGTPDTVDILLYSSVRCISHETWGHQLWGMRG